MPIDPNSPTSDIGMMYRDYLQSKGARLTNSNLQAAIAQSQREPGMIAGLSVQQPGGMHAEAPPNIAGASPNSSGSPMPLPPAVPTGMQQMPGPTPAQGAQAASQGGMPVPAQGSPDTPTVGMPAQPPQTPPPGQAPDPSQSVGGHMLPPAIANMSVSDALTALGIGGGTIASGLAMRGAGQLKGPQPPQQSPMPPPVGVMDPNNPALFPVGSAQAQRTTSPPMQGPPEAPTATSPIMNILKQDPVPAELPFVHGVNPVGKEIQGPPMGPPAMQGPPVGPPRDAPGNQVTESSIIENLLHPKLADEAPRVGNTVSAPTVHESVRGMRPRGIRGMRVP